MVWSKILSLFLFFQSSSWSRSCKLLSRLLWSQSWEPRAIKSYIWSLEYIYACFAYWQTHSPFPNPVYVFLVSDAGSSVGLQNKTGHPACHNRVTVCLLLREWRIANWVNGVFLVVVFCRVCFWECFCCIHCIEFTWCFFVLTRMCSAVSSLLLFLLTWA